MILSKIIKTSKAGIKEELDEVNQVVAGVDKAKAAVKAANARLETAEAAVTTANARVETAKADVAGAAAKEADDTYNQLLLSKTAPPKSSNQPNLDNNKLKLDELRRNKQRIKQHL